MVSNKTLLCIVDYSGKLLVVKEKEASLSVDGLMHAIKITFSEFGLPEKIASDAGTNFTSATFKEFCKKLNIQQSITSSYHYQSCGQVEACIKSVKCTIRNAGILTKISI